MVCLMGHFPIVDRVAVTNTPTEEFYDNSYVEEVKQTGFLREFWR